MASGDPCQDERVAHEPSSSLITVHGGDYEHTLGLSGHGERFELRYEPGNVVDIFRATVDDAPFPVAEMSLAAYLMLVDRGDTRLVALPLFPYRAFRHGAVFVRQDSDLTELEQLRGCRVAVADYTMTAAVWLRGILSEHHGTDWRDINWFTGPPRVPVPDSVAIETLATPPLGALLTGDVDAALLMTRPRPTEAGRPWPPVRRLLADSQQAERAYLHRTGVYPIMHTVVVRRDLLTRHEGLPDTVIRAYVEAKDRAYLRRLSRGLHPWGDRAWESIDRLFQGDPLPYGLGEANRRVLEVFSGYLLDQLLVEQVPVIDAAFMAAGTTCVE
jgi:4,5-dihydroxyphthalate decarboxylase